MTKIESFSPSVLIDGHTITPPKEVYIMALALNGCQWAIDLIADNEESFKALMSESIEADQ